MRETIELNGKLYRVEGYTTGSMHSVEVYEVDKNGASKNWFPIWAERYSLYDKMVNKYKDVVENLWQYVS